MIFKVYPRTMHLVTSTGQVRFARVEFSEARCPVSRIRKGERSRFQKVSAPVRVELRPIDFRGDHVVQYKVNRDVFLPIRGTPFRKSTKKPRVLPTVAGNTCSQVPSHGQFLSAFQ